MSFVSLGLLVVFLSLFIHYLLFYDHGQAYLAAMYHPGRPRNLKEWMKKFVSRVINFVGNRLGKETIDRLEKVDTEPKEYVKYMLVTPFLGILAGAILSVIFQLTVWKAVGLAVVCAILGVIIVRGALAKEWNNHQNDLKKALPEFVNYLKVSIIAGDTMEEAVRTSSEFIWGPLQKLITKIIRWSDGEMSFNEAMETMIDQMDDMDVVPVLQSIRSYHNNGITDRQTVFADMAENLSRIITDRSMTDLESMEAQLSLLLLAGLVSAALMIGIPFGLSAFRELTLF
ncbi:type II secretion system F family protein [Desulfosporosinus shakirovi]|uniref:type II secretion system F family protein n=1 Tax=Desulfosporosinus shakirovi TaxID=2885154 RepID=UPI001E591401|nr:hypothetical protein [Desulfosporosinus sp. SRJS8]MCB8818335.1 hypothetical protein [Desulfosporosinus sp. SRJS8]